MPWIYPHPVCLSSCSRCYSDCNTGLVYPKVLRAGTTVAFKAWWKMAFEGLKVCLSRNLVALEQFDELHGTLKSNGADLCLDADPSSNSPKQYHVISSLDHEKFAYLSAQGCNLIGPECIFRCAKEHRSFPKQGYTCCLAMDGVKVLASGFEKEEKIKIEKLVTAMCGELRTKTSLDIDFVVAKDVLAAKYKWALNVLRKPIVTIDWLEQCFREHRLVSHELYRIPPFTGLTICVSGILPDERQQIERHVVQYGGNYSGNLTKKCTHLLCNTAEGEKYMVARRWGHIKIVNQKWISQSIAARACLDEELYPVQAGIVCSTLPSRCNSREQFKQDKDVTSLVISATLDSSVSQPFSSATSPCPATTKEKTEIVIGSAESTSEYGEYIAGDSQTEANDLYLENCKILLAGFQPIEMRKLVNMVRTGGGSRYMSFNDGLTHIVVGRPSEIEMKEIRKLSVRGIVNVVKPIWLDDCSRHRREVSVTQQHIVFEDILLQGIDHKFAPNIVGSNLSSEEDNCLTALGGSKEVPKMHGFNCNSQGENAIIDSDCSKHGCVLNESRSHLPNQAHEGSNNASVKRANDALTSNLQSTTSSEKKDCLPKKMDEMPHLHQSQFDCGSIQDLNGPLLEVADIFKGCRFVFSKSFPRNRRDEVIQWILLGGGDHGEDAEKRDADFIIECHGSKINAVNYNSHATVISSHWIRCCLEERAMLDVGSHILYKPLPCRIPLPGFESMRFCVSQYEEKERILLRNLCHVLGAKFTEKLSRNVTHLLCKFTGGPKYEAACTWNIKTITADWLHECIRQDTTLPCDKFHPRKMSGEDKDVCFFGMTQHPTQAAHLASREFPSQCQVDSQGPAMGGDQTKGLRQKLRSKPAVAATRGGETQEPYPWSGQLKRSSATQDVGCSCDPWEEEAVKWSGGMDNGCKEDTQSPKSTSKRVRMLEAQIVRDSNKDASMDSSVAKLTRDEHNQLDKAKEPGASCLVNVLTNIETTDGHCQKTDKTENLEYSDTATAEDSDKVITPTLSFHGRSQGEAVHSNNEFPKNLLVRDEKEDEDLIMSSCHVNQAHDDDDIVESELDHVISYATRGTVRKKMMERPSRVSPPSTKKKKLVGCGTPTTRKKPPLSRLPQRKV